MRAATVEDVAQEFMRILAEGWSPDPEEFLHRVPEDLREDCRVRLSELLGDAQDSRAAEAEEAVEPEQDDSGFGDDEMIVFELDGSGPSQTVRVPSIDPQEHAADDPQADEPVADELEAAADPTVAIAAEAALEPEPDIDEPDEPETAEVAELEDAEPETAEIEQPEPVAVEEAEVDELAAEATLFSDVVAEEPTPAPEPEPEPEPKPQGLVKLSRAEAKAMFEAMDKARDANS